MTQMTQIGRQGFDEAAREMDETLARVMASALPQAHKTRLARSQKLWDLDREDLFEILNGVHRIFPQGEAVDLGGLYRSQMSIFQARTAVLQDILETYFRLNPPVD